MQGANVTIEFIDEIPNDCNLIYKLNKKEKSRDYVLYTCRVCHGKTIFSGRQEELKKSIDRKRASSGKKKIKKNILKDVLKSQVKEESFSLFDFMKNV